MSTAEKRAQLEASGEPWPLCGCHSEPMKWARKDAAPHGGHWVCLVRARETCNRSARKRYANDPDYALQQIRQAQERWANDPMYRLKNMQQKRRKRIELRKEIRLAEDQAD